MALPVVIPNTFANANASIPLSQLDNNFSTVAVAINGMANGAEALANVNITGGSIANASLSNVSISSGNVTINVANVTTLDTTNLEVTNIKAKDGTASATIADSTGVMTIGSSVLTTTDINGGTIDGTAIGGSTPAAGAFTTLSATGNVTLGDASADTLTINAASGSIPNGITLTRSFTDISGSPIGTTSLVSNEATAISSATLIGCIGDVVQNSTFSVSTLRSGFFRVRAENSGTVSSVSGGFARIDWNAAAAVGDMAGFDTSITFDAAAAITALRQYSGGLVSNAGGATVTTHSVFSTGAQTVGTNIYGFRGQIAAASNRYNLYIDGTANNYFAGNVGIGTSSPTAKLDVSSDVIRLRTAKTPASASATGNAGDIAWDSSYIYVCVATNTWKRVAIATW